MEEGEEGAEQGVEDKIKLEQAKLEQDKTALLENHSMMAEVRVNVFCLFLFLFLLSCLSVCLSMIKQSLNPPVKENI